MYNHDVYTSANYIACLQYNKYYIHHFSYFYDFHLAGLGIMNKIRLVTFF